MPLGHTDSPSPVGTLEMQNVPQFLKSPYAEAAVDSAYKRHIERRLRGSPVVSVGVPFQMG